MINNPRVSALIGVRFVGHALKVKKNPDDLTPANVADSACKEIG